MRGWVAFLWLSLRLTTSTFADTRAALAVGEPTECDRLASSPSDPDLPKGFPGMLKGEHINPDAAIPACRRAVETTPGDRRMRFQFGRALQSGKKFEEAARAYEQAASAGSASAMNALGALYFNGLGVAKDDVQARTWLQKGADLGDIAAQYNLGLFYENGWGVAKDYAQARAWYQKAADQGDADAIESLKDLPRP
jgi:TPR repeat protein